MQQVTATPIGLTAKGWHVYSIRPSVDGPQSGYFVITNRGDKEKGFPPVVEGWKGREIVACLDVTDGDQEILSRFWYGGVKLVEG
jgi:hypothetical protein